MVQKSQTPRSGRLPTVSDVAARAGVAPATVSNVITGRRPVAEALRIRVHEAIDVLGYKTNQVAASLRLKQTRSIGIVVPDLTNPFFAALVRHVEELAAESDFQILLVGSNETASQEAKRIRALISRRIDGLIIAPTQDNVSEIVVATDGRVPVVLVDRAIGAKGFDTIAADNVEAGYSGCRHLIELGHKHIAILETASALANINDRAIGYRKAMAEAGLAAHGRIIDGGLTIESCRQAIEPVLRAKQRPTAIFATAYVATLGTIKAIRAIDLNFPQDISLLGFDDFDWMTALRPYVSTIRQPVQELAINAWNLLHARIAGEVQGHLQVRLPCSLQVRESTAPPAKGRVARRLSTKAD